MNTREIYRKIIAGSRPDDAKIGDIIQASIDLKNMQQGAGWKRVSKFMQTQKDGTRQYMEKEASLVNAFSLIWLFNTFIKYLGVLWENRAYNRIDTYVNVTITRGEQYAEKRRKEAEAQAAKEARENGQQE